MFEEELVNQSANTRKTAQVLITVGFGMYNCTTKRTVWQCLTTIVKYLASCGVFLTCFVLVFVFRCIIIFSNHFPPTFDSYSHHRLFFCVQKIAI